MTDSNVGYSKKAQLKIQQMAFVLVAIMIFFAMIGLIYFAMSYRSLKKEVIQIHDTEAKETIRKLSGSPELAFTSSSDCTSCIDFDKAIQLAKNKDYKKFWNLNYLWVEVVAPKPTVTNISCTEFLSPPNCDRITIIDAEGDYATKAASVTLARWDEGLGSLGGFKYELGRIHASE